MNEPKETVDQLKRLISEAQVPKSIGEDGVPFVILERDQHVETLEHLRFTPNRIKATPTFIKADSLIRYVECHTEEGEGRLYVESSERLVVIIDDSELDDPTWREHRAALQLKHTPEWKTWTGANQRKFPQREFAQFIEDNLEDIANPPGAEMIDLIRNFQSTQSAEFRGVVPEKDGNSRLEYIQTQSTKAGTKGEVEIPGEFTVLIPPYEGGQPLPIRARLRFSIDGGKLVLWYDLLKVQKTLDLAMQKITDEIAKALQLTPFYGTP